MITTLRCAFCHRRFYTYFHFFRHVAECAEHQQSLLDKEFTHLEDYQKEDY